MSGFRFVIGIDLGNTEHALCVLNVANPQRQQVKKFRSDASIVEHLQALGAEPHSVAVAVEDKGNVVVDALVAAGFACFSINPKKADRFRERYAVSGAKDDKRDAIVLARSLVTDEHAFQRVAPVNGDIFALGALKQELRQLDDEHRMLANQLRALILRFFPLLLGLCEAADRPWFWALVETLKDPARARGVRRSTIEKALKRARSVTVDDVVALTAKAHLPPSGGVAEACHQQARRLIARLRLVEQQRNDVTRQLKERIKQMRSADTSKPSDVDILLSLPGLGAETAAVLLAHGRDFLDDEDRLRTQSGVAPVLKRSGKSSVVHMRHACSHHLQQAVFHWAQNAILHDEDLAARYRRFRERGHSHARALRGIADRLLHVLAAMMRNHTLYAAPKTAAAAA